MPGRTGVRRFLHLLALSAAVGRSCTADPTVPNTALLMPDDFESMNLVTWAVNYGDVPSEPLMYPENDWDEEIGGKGTILVDPIDNMYKAWYISQPGFDYLGYNSTAESTRMLSYAVSKDGLHWERPKLGLLTWEGQDTNLLLRLPGPAAAQYACVFVDPTARNATQRYEMLALLAATPAGFPQTTTRAVYQFFSEDGIQWAPERVLAKGPCPGALWCSDSLYINRKIYPNGTKLYSAIIKHGSPCPPGGMVPYDIAAGNQRDIVVSTSVNGDDWTPIQPALSPDWRDGAGVQWVSSISTIEYEGKPGTRPDGGGSLGGGGLTVGWLPVFHTLSQTIDMQLCASRDGAAWWRPERRSAVPLRPLGEYGGGMLWPYRTFVPDRDDPSLLHAYYSGCQGIHGDIHSTLPAERFAAMRHVWDSNGEWGYHSLSLGMEKYSPVRTNIWFRGALMRATWRADRLWSLLPAAGGDIPGVAVTREQSGVAGKTLWVNCQVTALTRSRTNGTLRAELVGSDGQVIPGFSMQDCIPFSGDSARAQIAWRSGAVVPHTSDGRALKIRFELLRARLYSFWWETNATQDKSLQEHNAIGHDPLGVTDIIKRHQVY